MKTSEVGAVLESTVTRTLRHLRRCGPLRIDEDGAARLYRKACDGDYATDCYNLGLMYDNGQGVAKDEAKAAQLFQKACDGGVAAGCSNGR